MKKLFAICIVLAVMVSGCLGTNNEVIQDTVETLAQSAGILVGANNPEIIPAAVIYQQKIRAFYTDGEINLMNSAINEGINKLVALYGNGGVTDLLIRANLIKLSNRLGLGGSIDIPGAEKLQQIAPERLMVVVDEFVGGMEMAKQ